MGGINATTISNASRFIHRSCPGNRPAGAPRRPGLCAAPPGCSALRAAPRRGGPGLCPSREWPRPFIAKCNASAAGQHPLLCHLGVRGPNAFRPRGCRLSHVAIGAPPQRGRRGPASHPAAAHREPRHLRPLARSRAGKQPRFMKKG